MIDSPYLPVPGQPLPPTTAPTSSKFRPLGHFWLPILLMLAMLVLRYLPQLMPDPPSQIWMSTAFGPLLCAVLIMLVWWLVFSRATWRERLIGFLGVGLVGAGAFMLLDPSMQGPAALIVTIPMGICAFALTAMLLGHVPSFRRTLFAVLLAGAGFAFSALLRSDGMWGDFSLGLDWRWNQTSEQLLADRVGETKVEIDSVDGVDDGLKNPEWPGFRGPQRNGTLTGVTIPTDWEENPPEELWRVPVGPGWSSFVVAGRLLFTQEQREENEFVVCYDADSGSEIWTSTVEARITDPLGGPGPRATPTLADGKVYTLGSLGHLRALDAKTGDVEWEVDIRETAAVKEPMWGFSASPIVVGSNVIVYAGGKDNRGTLAFDKDNGLLKWGAESGSQSYSSPQLCTIGETEFLVMVSNTGFELLEPATGEMMFRYEWKYDGYRALQPKVVGDLVLLPSGPGSGTRCIRIMQSEDEEFSTEELWTSRYLKPDFSDFVVHEGHAYGFDGSIFTCVDLSDGSKKWKRGRYGNGQVLLLADQDLMFVITEKGQGVLVEANPDEHMEVASMKVLTGRTWNHPVIVGDRLFVRNSQEAACYELATNGSDTTDLAE